MQVRVAGGKGAALSQRKDPNLVVSVVQGAGRAVGARWPPPPSAIRLPHACPMRCLTVPCASPLPPLLRLVPPGCRAGEGGLHEQPQAGGHHQRRSLHRHLAAGGRAGRLPAWGLAAHHAIPPPSSFSSQLCSCFLLVLKWLRVWIPSIGAHARCRCTARTPCRRRRPTAAYRTRGGAATSPWSFPGLLIVQCSSLDGATAAIR